MADNLNVISAMKQTVLRALLSDKDIVKLLRNSNEVTVPDMGLRYTQVFPWMYAPGTIEEVNSFIGMRVRAKNPVNAAARIYELTIYVMCHKEHMRINRDVCEALGLDVKDSGSKVDVLADKIDYLLNGSTDMGFGKLEFIDSDEFKPAEKHHGRYITYRVAGWNRYGDKL